LIQAPMTVNRSGPLLSVKMKTWPNCNNARQMSCPDAFWYHTAAVRTPGSRSDSGPLTA